MSARDTAENDARCPTPCDDACAVDCHEMHEVAWKRGHQPHNCPSRVIPPTEGRDTAEIDAPYHPRVAFTPGSIQGVVIARKRHRCENHLTDERHYIEPGQRYITNALPPDHPDIGNPGWWHLRVCLDCCPVEYDPRVIPPEEGVS